MRTFFVSDGKLSKLKVPDICPGCGNQATRQSTTISISGFNRPTVKLELFLCRECAESAAQVKARIDSSNYPTLAGVAALAGLAGMLLLILAFMGQPTGIATAACLSIALILGGVAWFEKQRILNGLAPDLGMTYRLATRSVTGINNGGMVYLCIFRDDYAGRLQELNPSELQEQG